MYVIRTKVPQQNVGNPKKTILKCTQVILSELFIDLIDSNFNVTDRVMWWNLETLEILNCNGSHINTLTPDDLFDITLFRGQLSCE